MQLFSIQSHTPKCIKCNVSSNNKSAKSVKKPFKSMASFRKFFTKSKDRLRSNFSISHSTPKSETHASCCSSYVSSTSTVTSFITCQSGFSDAQVSSRPLSQKSLELESLIFDHPSVTLRISLTPTVCVS
ncbi:hypothetical protein CLU79DRAFT_832288 [Phycomyces nitens]|nr:hypothetical protein CLU79DRAFT_832288 [Phycomyces nitens]